MKLTRNRHARKDDARRAPGSGQRPYRCLRRAIALATLAALALSAVPAQASPGGASVAFDGSSAAESELAFAPTKTAGASWYGPGLYGRKTACGVTLTPETIGVAHRSLPCGTTVKFNYHGQTLITQVIDRGPYVKGRSWDLTTAAHEELGLEGVGIVHYAVAIELASKIAR